MWSKPYSIALILKRTRTGWQSLSGSNSKNKEKGAGESRPLLRKRV